METKHTKGEWYIVATDEIEIATNKKSICHCVIQDYHNKDIEQIANAKLIAAAPDLLEALNNLIGSWNDGLIKVESIEEINEHKLLIEAEKAINKATK